MNYFLKIIFIINSNKLPKPPQSKIIPNTKQNTSAGHKPDKTDESNNKVDNPTTEPTINPIKSSLYKY